jgi:hypothetical protein
MPHPRCHPSTARRWAAVCAAALTVACKAEPPRRDIPVAGSAVIDAAPAAAVSPVVKPASALELVQRHAPSGSKVAPAELTAPGVELFVVSDAKPAADGEYSGGALVGVVGGAAGNVVEDRELLKAVIAGKPDRMLLARIAMQVAQRDSEGQVLQAATTREQRKAKVTPPVIKGDELVFWVQATESPPVVERGKLDLSTGSFELEPQLPHGAALAVAINTLGGGGMSRYPSAIKLLAASCAEPRAKQALIVALQNHPRDRSRAAIAAAIPKCGAVAVDPLINVMEHDRSGLVRTEAASALGRTGDIRARPALAKAARSDDANLAWAAKNALGKLN